MVIAGASVARSRSWSCLSLFSWWSTALGVSVSSVTMTKEIVSAVVPRTGSSERGYIWLVVEGVVVSRCGSVWVVVAAVGAAGGHSSSAHASDLAACGVISMIVEVSAL